MFRLCDDKYDCLIWIHEFYQVCILQINMCNLIVVLLLIYLYKGMIYKMKCFKWLRILTAFLNVVTCKILVQIIDV